MEASEVNTQDPNQITNLESRVQNLETQVQQLASQIGGSPPQSYGSSGNLGPQDPATQPGQAQEHPSTEGSPEVA